MEHNEGFRADWKHAPIGWLVQFLRGVLCCRTGGRQERGGRRDAQHQRRTHRHELRHDRWHLVAENRLAWTSAAVFRRRSEPLVEAFLGTSERQAGESSYTFVSQDRLAYFDGNGPFYDYTQGTPGGTGYASGQTNAEGVIEITHGEDVPVAPLKGTFKIVNKATGKLLTTSGLRNDATITQIKENPVANQSWVIEPIAPRAASDMAHVTIRAAKNTKFYLDALKYAADNGARVLLYSGDGNECDRRYQSAFGTLTAVAWHLLPKSKIWTDAQQ